MIRIPQSARQVLMSDTTSRLNKIHLAIGWEHFNGWFIEWKWQGQELNSRLLFRFGPDEPFVAAKSFDEDILPNYKFGKEIKQ